MLYVYGALMPLRVLEEVRFWKSQEKEHTVVIHELLPRLEPEYVRLLKQWEDVFARTEYASQQWIEAVIRSPLPVQPQILAQIRNLVQTSAAQSRRWIDHLMAIQHRSAAVKQNATAPVVLQHIIRESEYFLGILQIVITAPLEELQRNGDGVTLGLASGPSPHPAPQTGVTAHPNRREEKALFTETGEGTWSEPPAERNPMVPVGGHRLPPLPYAYDALEPHIDAETMRLHHDKHHLSYVEGLNKAETELAKARETGNFELVKHWERELAFHGAGHYLHTIFWNVMNPRGGGKPGGAVAEEIRRAFGSFERFHKQFSEAAEKVEGGGWALLVWSPRSHRVEILQAEKHQNLSQWDVIPLLVLDVWEHAYYLKYKTDRAAYIKAWWNVVHWRHVNERLASARQVKWTPY